MMLYLRLKGLLMKLYLVLYNRETKKQFTKYFDCEYEMDKFKRKLYYSKRLFVIEDSRDIYFPDYDK